MPMQAAAAALAFAVALSVPLPALARQAPEPASTAGTRVTTKSGLVFTVVKEGTGAVARAGQTVLIHETLTLPDGRLIFSSKGKAPVKLLLGGNQVIPGVDEGVTGMRVGERRLLLVPPALDGRTFDPSFIPPDAIRHYDIELVEILNDGGAAKP
jgi:FKBP-type peptidyl-prolyl cis-trans isomerase